MGNPTQNFALGNILREIAVDLNADAYSDRNGFFFRTAEGGVITYWPMNNEETESVTQTFTAQETFIVPVLCRKIAGIGSPIATGVYVGYGV